MLTGGRLHSEYRWALHPLSGAGCMCRKSIDSSRRAFTLVELLVVIAIIGVVVALACHNFQNSRGTLPPWAEGTPTEYGSSHFLILPYIEQQNIYQQSNGNSFNVRTSPVKIFTCPDDATVKGGTFGPSSAAYQQFNSTAINRTS